MAPALVVRFQKRLKSISGPKVAPNPAQAKLTMVKMTLFSSRAMTMATTAMRRRVSRETRRTSLSEAFLRNSPW